MACKNSIFQKVLTGLIIFNTVGLVGIIGGGFYTYKYITSGNFEKLIKSKIMGDIQSALPDAIGDQLPRRTGNSVPLPFK